MDKTTAQPAAAIPQAAAQTATPAAVSTMQPATAMPGTADSNQPPAQPLTDAQSQAISQQIGDKIQEHLQLKTDLQTEAKAMFKVIAGTNPDELTPEEGVIWDEAVEQAAATLLESNSVRTGFSESQTALLKKMWETRRTTARNTQLPTLQEVTTLALTKALLDDSKSLYGQGRFTRVYGFSYDDFKKEFVS